MDHSQNKEIENHPQRGSFASVGENQPFCNIKKVFIVLCVILVLFCIYILVKNNCVEEYASYPYEAYPPLPNYFPPWPLMSFNERYGFYEYY